MFHLLYMISKDIFLDHCVNYQNKMEGVLAISPNLILVVVSRLPNESSQFSLHVTKILVFVAYHYVQVLINYS